MKNFVYRLFFTRNDDLDTLQILFNLVVCFTLGLIMYLIRNTADKEVIVEGLITLRYLAGMLVITAVPSWVVPSYFRKDTKSPHSDVSTE